MKQLLQFHRRLIYKMRILGGILPLVAACGSIPPSPAATPTWTAAPAFTLTSTVSQRVTTVPPTPRLPTATPVPATATPTAVLPPSIGGQSTGDPYAPELGNTGYDVQRYTLQLTLDPAQVFVEGKTTIEATSELPNLVQLSLDFAGFEISELQVNGEVARYERRESKLVIDLPSPINVGESVTIQIAYSGAPDTVASPYVPFFDHLGLQFLGSSIFTATEPDGAHYWFPANDHPRDKATFRFEVTVPGGLTAVANGHLVDQLPQEDGFTTFVWEHDFPMAPYLATVAVGNYVRLENRSPEGILLRSYVFPDIQPEFTQATAHLGEAIDWMSDTFGPYPFEAFGFATIRLVNAALETQTMVIISEKGLNEETIIHELAHMWFGDWVSVESWGDIWRNEGLATYVYLMWETRDRPEELETRMQSIAITLQNQPSGDPLGNLPPQRMFGFDSYWKGAALIHALRKSIGEEAFFTGLRTFLTRYGGTTASQADFQSVMEEASGTSLDDFFAEWLQ